MADVKIEGNLNEFVDQIKSGVGPIVDALRINKAVIFNNTDKAITFYVYNYIDTAYWISAMQVLVAPGKIGVVAASGEAFKIHPDDDKNKQFLVSPGGAYIYSGPGDVDQVQQ